MTLALIATLGISNVYADGANEQINQHTLIDWSLKAQATLSKKLDEKLNQQLVQHHNITRMAEATDQPVYATANLVLAGKKLAHTNLSPLSSIPVVIIRSQKQGCLVNL